MSCPDWSRLVAHRGSRRGEEPEDWPRALAHLEVCSTCRRRALKADPTLLFRKLPAPEVTVHQVEAVRQAVAALRRSRRLDRPASGWPWRYAAAVLLLVGALLVAPGEGRWSRQGMLPGVDDGLAQVSDGRIDWSLLPLLESVEPRRARVYQLAGGDELSVVMIVDDELDV